MKRHIMVVILAFLLTFSINAGSQDNSTETNLTVSIINFTIVNIIPQEFNIGDAQFNIQVENTGDTELKNLVALVTGNGFSTYNVVPIDGLKQNEKSYIIVSGNFKTGGDIPLTIKINDKIFHHDVNIIDPNAGKNQQEEDNKQLIDLLSSQLTELENNYDTLDIELKDKKTKNYDTSEINLADLKNFLRTAQSSLAVNDLEKLKMNLNLALNEYNYQKGKLDSAQIIKKSFWNLIKNNLLLISSLGGAVITLFTLFELLKRKKQDLSKKAMEVKVILENKINTKDKKKSEDKTEEKKD